MSRRLSRLSLLALVLALAVPAAPASAQSPLPSNATVDNLIDWANDLADDPYVDPYTDPYTDPYGSGSTGTGSGQMPSAPSTPVVPTTPLVTTGTVPGKVARMRTDGKAAIPKGAPKSVRAIIAAANQIVGRPYKWGGGHAKISDSGYDCSGAVSYALIRAGKLASPLVSGSLARYGSAGAGRWTTIYANSGHVYMEVAGLRLDTSGVGDPTGRSGVRWRPLIGKRRGFHVRHVTGL